MGKNKVMLIGWDAADWKIINPLMDSGKMPALQSLVDGGVMGNLATLDPPMSPMLWTSIATGMHADKHGILNFTEPAPGNKGIRPVTASSRKVKAIWNILTQQQLKTHVVGWWPSHPAEPINGVCISNFYQRAHAPIDKPWPMRTGTVYPKSQERLFDSLRIHPSELTAQHILPFVPNAADIDQEKDRRLESIAKILSDCSTVHAAATWILEHEEWDFMAVYLDAIDHFSHGFMNFHPPRMKGIPEKMYNLYNGVVTGGYLYHDMMLARLLEFTDDDTTVILVSDHGFHSDHLRPRSIPKEPAGPAVQHRGYGIFCMKGPHIQKDERIYGARLLDVTPTILTLFDLPVGDDMDGKPLVQAYEHPYTPKRIPSWENVEGECGMLPPGAQSDPYAEQEAMAQLVALGYVDEPGENAQKSVTRTLNESNFFLARVHINKNQYPAALPILEKLYGDNPEQVRYGIQLAKCYQVLDRLGDCRRVVEAVVVQQERVDREHQAEQQQKKAAEKMVSDGTVAKPKENQAKIAAEDAAPRKPFNAQLLLLRGTLALAEGKPVEALKYLRVLENRKVTTPSLFLQLGRAYLKRGMVKRAKRAFKKALKIDPDSYLAHDGMAAVSLRLRENEDAADYALNAIGLLYHNHQAHFRLGKALYRLGHVRKAVEALEVSVAMAPGFKTSRRLLAGIYRNQLFDTVNADRHKAALQQLSGAGKRGGAI